ncbi:M3 family metallopeptidase [Hellea sp.]|nr:M3 family metallopeptidase [Hellea sp.]MDA8887971.1 M3 family metallopeptidase [Hellea sp.]MDB4845483.1 M3 family metallopeptidase [Hellea sp.]MDC0650986.1 M3 family metallopeptidase [Hellea sp.]MDC1061575.1 M3 family metallopeptidase [Hellea sp.]
MIKFTKAVSATTLVIALAACSNNTDTSNNTFENSDTYGSNSVSVMSDTITITEAELKGNPFVKPWETPYGVPPFDIIKDSHFMPAIKAGILELRKEIDEIVLNNDLPSFENTIVALDLAGNQLSKVSSTFGNITGTDTNDTLRSLQGKISPLLTREYNKIQFNEDLFARVKFVYEKRDSLNLDEQDARLLELTHRGFVRAGANLSLESKARIAKINEELSSLTTEFGQNILASTVGFKMEITNPKHLSGLSESFKASIKVGNEERWVVGLNRSPFETFMTQSTNRDLRKKLFDGYRLRGSSGDINNGPIVIKIAQLRSERAQLMGYKSHAHYQLEPRMAKTPEAAVAFLLRVWNPALERVKNELSDIQSLIEADGETYQAEGQDWWHYAERVRQERYEFDDAALAPYLELNAVREGAFDVANKLFGVSFEEVETPVWNPVVTTYDVKDENGTHLGLFMMDMYARDSKRGGAWMNTFRSASDIQGNRVRPLVTNNMNLTPPPAGEPTLMRFDEVITLFHEFGHGLHGLMTQVRYENFSGVDGPRDYTEFPAQMLEHWAEQKQVLAQYAKHHETGAVIPDELVEKMLKASTFNQGFKTTEFIAASLLDLAWHSLTPDEAAKITDAAEFERETLESYGLLSEIEPRYRSQYFAHIFAGGYSAGYYAYLWSEILDADGFVAFKETGDIYDPVLAARLKKWVYESGGLRDADELYRNFRGQDPSIEPLLEIRGLTEGPKND